MKLILRVVAAVAFAACGATAFAQDKPAAAPASAERPRTYALISAVGDQFTYLRQKQQVGSHLEPYVRRTMKVPALDLDAAILRGLDRVIGEREPESKREFMRLNPLEMEKVRPQDRERIAIGKLVSILEKYPQRAEWDQIIVVTPSFQYTENNGMGSKLQGIGMYVQPLYSGRLPTDDGMANDFDTVGGEETVAPEDRKKKSTSKRYVAPYSYTQLWILDAKTLQVIQKETRRDAIKLFDPDSTAIDVEKILTKDQLTGQIMNFVERSSSRALREAIGTVTITEVPQGGAKATEPKK